MKTAYEIAMERLNQSNPSVSLTEEQKKQIAELDALYQAKIAEKELFLRDELSDAEASGDFEALAQLQKQLASERKVLTEELEAKKEEIRKTKPAPEVKPPQS